MKEYYTHLNEKFLLEIAEVGGFNNFIIIVYGSEGPIPHFHFESLDGELDGCIRLDKPEYFVHGKHNSRLKRKDGDRLIEWLKSPHKSFGIYGLSNWQVICIYWNDNNIDYPFNTGAKMPDYTQLN